MPKVTIITGALDGDFDAESPSHDHISSKMLKKFDFILKL